MPTPQRKARLAFGLISLLFVVAYLSACGGAPLQRAPISEGDFGRNAALSAQRQTVLQTAQNMLGVPYRSGGVSSKGFDCSGLTFYSYQQARIAIPRTSLIQYRQSKPVSAARLQAGDLVFFRIKGRTVSHVGIYQGGNKFIHAPGTGDRVTIESMDHPYWRKRFVRGGRFI